MEITCAHSRFEGQARRHPHRPAVVSGSIRLTYAELDRLANGLAHRLAAGGVRPGSLVGVCVERDEWLLVALLGVLKAGAGYVPLDPASPVERNHFLVADAGLEFVVASGTPDLPADLVAVRDVEPAGPLSTEIAPHDPAYVIYTSGTTGAPKGVLVEHRNLANLLSWSAKAFEPAELRGVLAASSVCFDASVLETFIPLAAGGTVVLADNLLALPTLPARDEVTLLFGVPSVLATLLRDPLPPGVRTVLTGGEAVNRALCDRLYANPGVRRVVNLYGPTETTVICAGADVDRDGAGPPPIGRAIAGAVLSVHDPDGAEGELWVAGPVVARGYLGRPDFGPEGYRTGDLVRRQVRGDGEAGGLYFVGRVDDQVKVRGHRVEPGEVVAVLTGHPDVRHAVAGAVDDRLVAHVEADGVQESELRTWLRARLPAYLVPSRIGVLARMPVTTSGKVDRAALPDLPARRDPGVAFTAPTGRTEGLIAGIVADVLGLPEVGAHDRFADLGGHSLAAARVVSELSRTLGTTVPPAVFLRHPTVAGLAAALADVPAEPPLRHHERESYPLTATQREFWLLRQLAPASPATTVAVAIGVTGPVTAAAVSAALTAITARHEVLRGRVVVRDGEPEVVIAPVTPVPVDELAGPHRAAAGHVFDLTVAPLVRATLIRTGDTTAELVVVLDHFAFDGSSVSLLLTELAAELAGESVAPLPIQVGDLALHDHELAGTHMDFWRAELAGAAIPDDLPGRDTPPGHRSERLTVPLDRTLVDRVADLAAASAATPFAVYLAALGLVVGGLTNRADVVVGAPAARRHRPGTERLIGPLVDVLPLRVRLAAGHSFRDLVKECAARITAALAHQELPSAALLPAHRHPGASRTPVLLSMQPLDEPVTVRCGEFRLDLHSDLGSGGSPNELTVFVARTVAGVELQVEYAADRFSAADADRLARRLLATLTAGLSTPDGALPDLADPDERAAALALADGPPVPPGPASVVDAVLAQAAERPAAIAVSGTGGDLTYAALAALSGRIAAGLVAAGVRPGDVVGVCLPRDRELPAALLAVGRAGAACLPMDPTHPVDRLAWLAGDAGAAVVLVAGRDLPSVSTVDITRLGTPAPVALPGVTEVAYLLHTSGSTGTPKAVAVTHANLAAAVAGVLAAPGMGPADVMLALAPLSFDVSAGEIWAPLCAGGRCVVAERSVATDGFALAELIDSAGVTVLDVTPTTLRMLLAAGWPGTSALRVLTGGETLDSGLARQVLPRVAALWNCYGPTETTITSTAHRVTEVGSTVPIGRPLPGERCYVVDPLGRLVPPGAPGELWIGGAGVALGYHGRPELTEVAFVPDPVRPGERCYRTGDVVRWRADGELEFLGRRDDQVKVRGYRIELGEVTAALRAVPGVADAAVATAGTAGDTHLVGYLTPAGVDTDVVRAALRASLPDHMVPRRWVLLSALPVLPNGKVDRAALPDPPREDRPRVDPSGDAELLVAQVWAAVLGRPSVFADDDFFALGGHSFAATRVVGRLREALAVAVPVQLLFDRPVLADFAAELTRLLLDDLLTQSQGTGA